MMYLHGYKDRDDFYERNDPKGHIDGIRVPMLILSALDDPLIEGRQIPVTRLAANPNIVLALTKRGGHLGFSHSGFFSPRTWSDRVAIRFLQHFIARAQAGENEGAASEGAPPTLASSL
jgi:predicted alpha/beta-fold hydrolase